MPNIQLVPISSSAPTVVLSVGPEKKIEFTRQRAIAKADIPGYRPAYQDMGMEESVCRFNAVLLGYDGLTGQGADDTQEPNALEQAQKIDDLKDQGEPLKFLYGSISRKVIIRSFNYQYHRADYVRYDIEFIEISDDQSLQQQQQSQTVQSPDTQASNSDASTSSELTGMAKVLDDVGKNVKTVLHLVQQGENLRSVAGKLYRNPHLWQELAVLNEMHSAKIPDTTDSIQVPLDNSEMTKLVNILSTEIPKILPQTDLDLPTMAERFANLATAVASVMTPQTAPAVNQGETYVASVRNRIKAQIESDNNV